MSDSQADMFLGFNNLEGLDSMYRRNKQDDDYLRS